MKRRAAKPPRYCARFLLLVTAAIIFVRLCEGLNHTHKVFPAAQVEVYTENSGLLCIVRAKDINFVKVGPATINEVVDAAIARCVSKTYGERAI